MAPPTVYSDYWWPFQSPRFLPGPGSEPEPCPLTGLCCCCVFFCNLGDCYKHLRTSSAPPVGGASVGVSRTSGDPGRKHWHQDRQNSDCSLDHYMDSSLLHSSAGRTSCLFHRVLLGSRLISRATFSWELQTSLNHWYSVFPGWNI